MSGNHAQTTPRALTKPRHHHPFCPSFHYILQLDCCPSSHTTNIVSSALPSQAHTRSILCQRQTLTLIKILRDQTSISPTCPALPVLPCQSCPAFLKVNIISPILPHRRQSASSFLAPSPFYPHPDISSRESSPHPRPLHHVPNHRARPQHRRQHVCPSLPIIST